MRIRHLKRPMFATLSRSWHEDSDFKGGGSNPRPLAGLSAGTLHPGQRVNVNNENCILQIQDIADMETCLVCGVASRAGKEGS